MLTNKEISEKAQDYEPKMDMAGTIARARFVHGAKWANEQNAAEIEELKFELEKTKVEVRQLLDALAKCGAYDRQDIVAKIDTILEKYDRK